MNSLTPSLIERISHHIGRPVEPRVRHAARRHLLDWLACVAGALRSELAAGLRGQPVDPLTMAAFLGNVLEMDDVHRAALLHPGPVIWPAVLGSIGAATMDDALAAGVRGYEAMIAIGATFDARHYAFYHPTATAGIFGAAACTAGLLTDDAVRVAHAMALAGSVSGGAWQTRHSPNAAKQWHVVHAIEAGRSAAQHALRGVTGPLDVLDGEQGLHAASCAAPKRLVLKEGWRIDEVSFKPWGACRHAHPAIDAALELRRSGALNGPIRVETFHDALVFCDRPTPRSATEAKFSIQHAVAVVAWRGEPELADFEPDAIAALAGARGRVSVAERREFTARYPDHFGARVETEGGSVELDDTRGDPERPLSEEALLAKVRALMAWGGVGGDAELAIDACLHGNEPGRVLALLERWL